MKSFSNLSIKNFDHPQLEEKPVNRAGRVPTFLTVYGRKNLFHVIPFGIGFLKYNSPVGAPGVARGKIKNNFLKHFFA